MTETTEKRKKNAHGPTVNAIKRAKFVAKQERRRQALLEQQKSSTVAPQKWQKWFNDDRKDYAAFISKEDVLRIRELKCKQHQLTDKVCNANDERLERIASWIEPFFDLKGSYAAADKEERLFISEGTESVRLMVQRCDSTCPPNTTTARAQQIEHENNIKQFNASPPPVRILSILCKPSTFFESPIRLIDDVEKRISEEGAPFKVVIGTEDALSEIAGFNIARGALACGVVPTYFQNHGYEWLLNRIRQKSRIRLLALDAVCDTANLGSIIRTAAALSIDAIILSNDSCDAFYRQSVRVSMGHIISIPILRVCDWRKGLHRDEDNNTLQNESGGLPEFIAWLRDQMEIQCLAAVVGDNYDSQPTLSTLEAVMQRGESNQSCCCVVGNEGNGIRNEVVKECNQRIKISMATGIDSLSLPVAAAILMYGLSQH